MSEISIIILTFNSSGFVKPCLESIFSQDYKDFEVIVVDNASKDETVDFIKKNYTQIILIENKENLGAARARNQGIKVAQGQWVLTLDCDIILEKDFLHRILKAIRNCPSEIGMIQPKVLMADKRTIYSCGIHLSQLLKRFYDIGKGKRDFEQFDNSKYVFGACSADALYTREMLEEVKEDTGYFDERFFFLVEDVDLAWRAQRKGWKAIYYPEAECYHCGNSSSADKPLRQYLCWRNRKLMLKKYRINKFKSALSSLFYDFPRLAFLSLTNPYVGYNEIKY